MTTYGINCAKTPMFSIVPTITHMKLDEAKKKRLLESVPRKASYCVIRPVHDYGVTPARDAWGPVILCAISQVAELSMEEISQKAGCKDGLIDDILSAKLRPTPETLERIANAVSVETRIRVQLRTKPSSTASRFDNDPDRVRHALKSENDLRKNVGAPPLEPPPEIIPPWDGSDPAPSRWSSAWPTRSDFGGTTASLMRHGPTSIAKISDKEMSRRTGLSADELHNLYKGHISMPLDGIEYILNKAGMELQVRLEVYEVHDDVLHLCAIKDPELTLKELEQIKPKINIS